MPTSYWFSVFISVWWLPLVLVVAEKQQGDVCSANRCGKLTISHPFWLANTEAGRPCGSLDFEVACFNNTLVLRSSVSTGFAIIGISYEEHNLHAVDLHKEEDYNCHFPRWNTSDELGLPFKVSPSNLNHVFYNCTKTTTHLQTALVEMSCGNGSNAFVRARVPYDPTRAYGGYALEGCDAIIMPVLGSLSETNATTGISLYAGCEALRREPNHGHSANYGTPSAALGNNGFTANPNVRRYEAVKNIRQKDNTRQTTYLPRASTWHTAKGSHVARPAVVVVALTVALLN